MFAVFLSYKYIFNYIICLSGFLLFINTTATTRKTSFTVAREALEADLPTGILKRRVRIRDGP